MIYIVTTSYQLQIMGDDVFVVERKSCFQHPASTLYKSIKELTLVHHSYVTVVLSYDKRTLEVGSTHTSMSTMIVH